jgi:hypothetical protein
VRANSTGDKNGDSDEIEMIDDDDDDDGEAEDEEEELDDDNELDEDDEEEDDYDDEVCGDEDEEEDYEDADDDEEEEGVKEVTPPKRNRYESLPISAAVTALVAAASGNTTSTSADIHGEDLAPCDVEKTVVVSPAVTAAALLSQDDEYDDEEEAELGGEAEAEDDQEEASCDVQTTPLQVNGRHHVEEKSSSDQGGQTTDHSANSVVVDVIQEPCVQLAEELTTAAEALEVSLTTRAQPSAISEQLSSDEQSTKENTARAEKLVLVHGKSDMLASAAIEHADAEELKLKEMCESFNENAVLVDSTPNM